VTADETKELTLWMRAQGVAQFTAGEVSVVFHPRAIQIPKVVDEPGAEDAEPSTRTQKPKDDEESFQGLPVSELMHSAPDA
jgi:hypothetical protein